MSAWIEPVSDRSKLSEEQVNLALCMLVRHGGNSAAAAAALAGVGIALDASTLRVFRTRMYPQRFAAIKVAGVSA